MIETIIKKGSAMADASAGAALIKLYGIKVVAGAIAVGLTFLFMWPKTAKEGVIRISATIACSALFGDALANWVAHVAPYLLGVGEAARMPVYALAGLPGWWVLGWLINTMQKRKNKDFPEILEEFKK